MLRTLFLLFSSSIALLVTAQLHYSPAGYAGPQMVMTSSGLVPIGGSSFGNANLQQPPPPYGSLSSSYGGIQNGANLLPPYSRPGFQGIPGQNGAQPGFPGTGQFGGGFGGQQQQMGAYGGGYQHPGSIYGQFHPYGGQMQGLAGQQSFGHGLQGGYPYGQVSPFNMLPPHAPYNAGGMRPPFYNAYSYASFDAKKN